eukprot:CAMPEP_0201133968 /NCGR_PEP_ID=MMETSP0850-20130426/50262_1 /ASSEMBLY_ACC=CAM_ASM_000622 /TAXON_ID=183588 /ORGANISM="Pseudo-nitzschia fraudulenta, Strain WWA7" /LENGTH=450 /DNA_ID=CAMNT_0047404737 /DNA_START=40 /DNA_END=1392 /DNA_ORIENTATION=+
MYGGTFDVDRSNGGPNDSSGTSNKIIRTWIAPPKGVTEWEGTSEEMKILFETLPKELSDHLIQMFPKDVLINLNEIYLQLGQIPECVVVNKKNGGRSERIDILNRACTSAEINLFASFFDCDTRVKRKGIPGTLHRVSLITHPMKNPVQVLGVAVRVGRALQGLIETMTGGPEFLYDLANSHKSLLIIGKPGMGKTTALREIANILSQNKYLNTVVVDKTCELAGDGLEPHPAIGKARWMPVGQVNMQAHIMREAVENQTPDCIIVDEISSRDEVDAAKTIAQRGVQLIATVHGTTLPEVLHCRERGDLLGGCSTVTLSGREADRRHDKRKQVLKRGKETVFQAAIELHSRTKWIYHPVIKDAVDAYLEGNTFGAQQLEPGVATNCRSIPADGCLKYSTEPEPQPQPQFYQVANPLQYAPQTANQMSQSSSRNRRNNKGARGGNNNFTVY